MEGKIKLLWCGDSPAASTGFGRVSQAILENLYSLGRYDISVLGVNQQIGDPHCYEGIFRIYPAKARGNVFGIDRVAEVISKEKPDIIVINNDLWIVSEIVKQIPEGNRVISYSPVDALPVAPQWVKIINDSGTRMVTYTTYARDGILATQEVDKVDIIGHGVDTDSFYPMLDARKFINGIPSEAFVVMNLNRNQPRKRLDLFLKGCATWLNSKPSADRNNIQVYLHTCFIPGTKVVTSNGIPKSIQDVIIGDKVLDSSGNASNVIDTISRPYTGDVIRLKCQGSEDILVTPEHPVLGVKGKKCYNGKKTICSKACKARFKTLKSGIITTNCGKRFYERYKTEFINASDLSDTDFVAIPKPKVEPISTDIKFNSLSLNADLSRLFGLYVAEGSSSGNNISFSLNIKERDLISFIDYAMNKYFSKKGKWYSTSKNGGNLVFCSKSISEWFRTTFGAGAHNKFIPDFILYSDTSLLRSFVKGLYDGDGCFTGLSFGYYSVSINLIYQLKYVLLRLGIVASLRKTCPDTDGFYGYTLYAGGLQKREMSFILEENIGFKSKSFSRIWSDDNYFYVPVISTSVEKYTGIVYNLETDPTHTYNTEFLCVHNCLNDLGWNLVDLAKRWGIQDRVTYTDQNIIRPDKGLPLDGLCKIYNIADVNVMASAGEGWGLSPCESAACGITQVVADNSALKEIWTGTAPLIKIKDWEVLTGGINTEGAVVDTEDMARILDDLYVNREKVKEYGKKAYDLVQQERFSWKYLAGKFDKIILEEVNSNRVSKKVCQ
jgi:intein/homing endonuclease